MSNYIIDYTRFILIDYVAVLSQTIIVNMISIMKKIFVNISVAPTALVVFDTRKMIIMMMTSDKH